jgi:hypothetical protein
MAADVNYMEPINGDENAASASTNMPVPRPKPAPLTPRAERPSRTEPVTNNAA